MSADATEKTAAWYNELYAQGEAFKYALWLYKPYIRAVVKKANVAGTRTCIDIGCGQGFFTHLLSRSMFFVTGVDVSEAAVRSAKNSYGAPTVHFAVCGMQTAPVDSYDCVFVRSLSVYNVADFATNASSTDELLRSMTEDGTLIFLYNTRMRPTTPGWRYHTVADARSHFARYNAQLYFTLRVETLLFGRFAFNRFFTFVNERLSQWFGFGGDLLCIVRKTAEGRLNDRAALGILYAAAALMG
jgi:SAM-dependent methyltransferase